MAPVLQTQPSTSPCDQGTRAGGALERTRFYPRQLVTPDDLTQDQVYFREKHKRHNRLLHGWGVVCGACVRRGRGDCEVIVEPGYVLGPHGDEIVIDREVTVDVCALGAGEQDGCCEPQADPWCRDVRASCPEGRLYLAVRYDECLTRPVRHPGGGCGCGCDDDACEHSRVRDGYAIALLRELPAPYTTPLRQPPIGAVYPCADRTARGCPPCPPAPWVVLADVVMGTGCRVLSVDCFAHRRHVVTFAEFFWACPPRAGATTGAQPVPMSSPLAMAHVVSAMSGAGTLVDVDAAFSTEPPRATVTMRRADGSAVSVPAHFAVEPGETLADLLNREGDRELYDPASGAPVTLRALYASADASPTQPLANAAAALALLEGRTLRAPGAPDEAPRDDAARRDALRELLAPDAFGRLGDDPARAPGLAAGALRDVAASPLAAVVEGMTIAEVAAMAADDFVARAVANAKGKQQREREAAAREAWGRARRVVDAVEGGEG